MSKNAYRTYGDLALYGKEQHFYTRGREEPN
jgi:hypothetical protein